MANPMIPWTPVHSYQVVRTLVRGKIMKAQSKKYLSTFNAFVKLEGFEVRSVESMMASIGGCDMISDTTNRRMCNGTRITTRVRVWSVTKVQDVMAFLDYGSLVGAAPSYAHRPMGSLVLSRAGDPSFAAPPFSFRFTEKWVGPDQAFTTLIPK